ncbi:DNA processing protein [Novimethylophilus kurashikiensis]|uniref:DNA processing protein n=1 Tax=Novimethylophilus kurashikiensis TaxID=1825523 RepID=A0A2R5FAZ6_9PROT|nr:DNA-processing protein DprA [Novimethylophilus kurashikiensis]GBG13804.1 DNA processing protein [Novimethylophilus kurashikiensis]
MTLPQEEARDWIGLSLIPGLGGETYRRLLAAFGSPQQIYAASASHLRQVVNAEIASAIGTGPHGPLIDQTLAWLEIKGNHLITLGDKNYPQAFLEIPDPPVLFYAKGNTKLLNAPTIGIVGSRHATPQGLKNAEFFAQALSETGWCVASGMALGIDGAAHVGALKGSGSTIAVVGTGLDIVYPSRHRELAHQIVEKGVLVSEYPLSTPSKAHNFPRRNRLISGLSRGVLVVEANPESGSLITARLAAEQGREVFAIPGSIHSPLSKGCHQLIKQGAKLVDNIHDILDEFSHVMARHEQAFETAKAEDTLLSVMGFEVMDSETLIRLSGLTSDQLSAKLLTLELEGSIASLPGGRFQRIT